MKSPSSQETREEEEDARKNINYQSEDERLQKGRRRRRRRRREEGLKEYEKNGRTCVRSWREEAATAAATAERGE